MARKIRFATAPDVGSQELTEEIIRIRAYELFELHGCQHGHDVEHWLEAEAEVLGKKSGTSADAGKYATHRDSAA
jgi:Protein of unknown function (DUF2934)